MYDTVNEQLSFALGLKPVGDGEYVGNDEDKYFVIKSDNDITAIKNKFKDKYFGYYSIRILSESEKDFGYLPEAIVVDNESEIRFDNNIVVMVVMP